MPKIPLALSATCGMWVNGSQSGETLDLATVIKASQAILGEIVLEQLLMKLMKILLENAGAQTGYLILEQGGKYAIEASGTVETDNITVLPSLPLKTRVPISIINYVARSRESVICNSAIAEALSFYLHNDYAAAAERFAICGQICPKDTVVQIYLKRMAPT